MYKINHTTTNELSRVQEKITKELASEKIIQDIYQEEKLVNLLQHYLNIFPTMQLFLLMKVM